MKKNIILIVCFTLIASVLCACSGQIGKELPASSAGTLKLVFDAENRYTGFEDLPSDYTPDQAVADGCFVTVSDGGPTSVATLYGGGERWTEFLAASKNGNDASMRAVMFIAGKPCYADTFYSDGVYRHFECESDLGDKKFTSLLELTGGPDSAEKDSPIHVLANSDVTYADVLTSMVSSAHLSDTDIPFVFLGYDSYLNGEPKTEALEAPEGYDNYTDITPESLASMGAKLLKDGEKCESVLIYGEKIYPVGNGFGGYGIVDAELCEIGEKHLLIFTYSFGSGMHRSHIGVLDIDSGSAVFQSEAFSNIDIIIEKSDINGVYYVYEASVTVGDDFADTKATPVKKLGSVDLSAAEIGFTADSGNAE